MSGADPDWYEGFFGEEYLAVAPRDAERTAHEAAFVVEKLGLEPGARVLDLACGHGRHTLELARRGLRVTGLDLSEPSLAAARADAAAAGLDVDFVHGDMRELPWQDEFDAVVNLFTAFGYFADEADDERVLAGLARALRPGGSFLLDTFSVFLLARAFQPQAWEQLDDGRLWLEQRSYDQLAGRSEATWTFVAPGGARTEVRHSVRAYSLPELRRLFARAGLETVQAWGSWDGDDFGFESRRLIVHSCKPA